MRLQNPAETYFSSTISIVTRSSQAREAGMTAEERLRFHQQHSKILEALHGWLEAQFAERKVEPNSGLGKAITYLLRHWKALTLFLRQAGASLDNNLCERALKRGPAPQLCAPSDYAEYLTRRCDIRPLSTLFRAHNNEPPSALGRRMPALQWRRLVQRVGFLLQKG